MQINDKGHGSNAGIEPVAEMFFDATQGTWRASSGMVTIANAGPWAVSGSVSLTPTAAPADGAANSALYGVANYGMLLNGASLWDRVRGANAASGTTGTGLLGAGGMVYDGALWWSKRGNNTAQYVQGPAADNGALAGNPLRLGLSDATNIQTWAQGNYTTAQQTLVGVAKVAALLGDNASGYRTWNGAYTDSADLRNVAAVTSVLFNSAAGLGERQRPNIITNQFNGSNATSGITNHATQTNYNNAGLIATLNITAVAGTLPTLDITLQIADGAGTFYNLTDSAGNTIAFQRQTTTGTDTLKLAPGLVERLSAVANKQYNSQLPRSYRFVSTVGGNAMSFTYRLDVSELK